MMKKKQKSNSTPFEEFDEEYDENQLNFLEKLNEIDLEEYFSFLFVEIDSPNSRGQKYSQEDEFFSTRVKVKDANSVIQSLKLSQSKKKDKKKKRKIKVAIEKTQSPESELDN
jgi:hypothetical protein